MKTTVKATVEIHILTLAFMLDELESLKLTNTKTYYELKQKYDYIKSATSIKRR